LGVSRRFGVAEFGLFLGQQAQQGLTTCFVCFDGEQPTIVLDIHMSHGSVHGVVPIYTNCGILSLPENYSTAPGTAVGP